MRLVFLSAVFAAVSAAIGLSQISQVGAQSAQSDYSGVTPRSLNGPFIVDVASIMYLDSGSSQRGFELLGRKAEYRPNAEWEGRFGFMKMLSELGVPIDPTNTNPFNAPSSEVNTVGLQEIGKIIQCDLGQGRFTGRTCASSLPDMQPASLKPAFLQTNNARVELVGIVARLDRDFTLRNSGTKQYGCGEISLIYRFAYPGSEASSGNGSRLPVTLNLVLRGLPSSPTGYTPNTITCSDVAGRWLRYIETRTDPEMDDLTLLTAKDSPLALLNGRDILRLELNMQAFRLRAQEPATNDLGNDAGYLFRVFHWQRDQTGNGGHFRVAKLPNQIDRQRLLPLPENQERRKRFFNWLETVDTRSRFGVVGDLNLGTHVIPEEFLTEVALSRAPGGMSRSANQPFWNSPTNDQQIVSNEVLNEALKRYRLAFGQQSLQFVSSAFDLRARLNDGSCTSCHQTRAIAGFHFPGADRPGTAPSNAVKLAGSPHFWGDQPRRMAVLRALANNKTGKPLPSEVFVVGYAARPLNRFGEILKETQLLGGWGTACLLPETSEETTSIRQWGCKQGLVCRQVFASDNDPRAGVCLPAEASPQIGDPTQEGRIITPAKFGEDYYCRSRQMSKAGGFGPSTIQTYCPSQTPMPLKRPAKFSPQTLDQRYTLIDVPESLGPSWIAARQEWFRGESNFAGLPLSRPNHPAPQIGDPNRHNFLVARLAISSGGFPGGMLRTLGCDSPNLPNNASCGLVAAGGFNSCVAAASGNKVPLSTCFDRHTSYAGLRACDAANPCRDDYICLQPMNYSKSDHNRRLQEKIAAGSRYSEFAGYDYEAQGLGELPPNDNWAKRNDRRGLCIPPYFVFQFRSDSHPENLVRP